jgi:hypothetical protein
MNWTKTKKTCWTVPGGWSRIHACPARPILAQQDVTIEIPKYSINHAKENH